MAKIKTIKAPKLAKMDVMHGPDEAFWQEFFRLEEIAERREGQSENGREVTITIKDNLSGEEWVVEGVKLVKEWGARVGD